MSTRWKRSSVSATSRSRSRDERKSAETASTSPPSSTTALATSSSAEAPRAQSASAAPSRANAIASARPRPRDAPVMSATFPPSRAVPSSPMHPSCRRCAPAPSGRRPRLASVVGRKLLDEAAANRQQGGLGAVTDPQLLQDVADVRLDRLLRKRQPAGDLLVGKALGQQTQHIAFARREVRKARRLRRMLNQSGRDFGMQGRLPLVGLPNRPHQLIRLHVLEQVPGGAGLQGGEQMDIIEVAGQDQDGRASN